MDIAFFAEEYDRLSNAEKALFAEATSTLLDEGLIWREDETKRQIYTFLSRHTDLVTHYLELVGWVVRHHEHCRTFQVIHGQGYHKKRFNLDTTIWLLLIRMLYAEKQESMAARVTRYPTITMEELIRRYIELPGSRKHFKINLMNALSQLQHYPLIRAASGGNLRVENSEQVIELLPPLEVVIPASNAASVAAQLAEYFVAKQQSTETVRSADIDEADDKLDLDIQF